MTDEAALKIVLEALPPQTPGTESTAGRGPAGKAARAALLPGAKLPTTWKITAGERVIAKKHRPWPGHRAPRGACRGVYRLEVTDAL